MAAAARSRIAGTWYPGGRNALGALLDDCVGSAPKGVASGRIVGLIVPHAGLRYSGRIAAAAYRLLNTSDVDRVLILGPCHRGGDGLEVLAGESIETPLGSIEIDGELDLRIEAFRSIVTRTASHGDEHSVEVQFPFVQRFLPGVPVTSVLMGFQTPETISAASEWLTEVVQRSGRKVLLVASSDLSHHDPREQARALDDRVVDCLERLDPAALRALLAANPRHACGGGPMVAVMEAARALGAVEASVLAYGDSGDVTGDLSGVVGYVSAVLCEGA